MKKLLFIIYILFTLTLSSCGYFASQNADFNSKKEGNELPPEQVPSTKVVAVISQNQILPNYQHCLGLERQQISAATRTAFTEAAESLAPEGEVTLISGPMLMAVTKVSSEVCNDLIAVENGSSSRRYFDKFSLDNANNGQGNNETAARNIASACWGRQMTDEEWGLIDTSLASVTTINGKTNKDSALFLCTTVLSSSQAIRF